MAASSAGFPAARPVAAGCGRLRLAWIAAAWAAWLLLAPTAHAAGLQVSPVLVEFGAADTAQVLRLLNTTDAPMRAQVRVFSWTQSGGAEQLQATRDLVASPPIIEVGAGGEQVVRVIRLQPGAPAAELSYRLLIDELPAAPAAGQQGVQFLIRHSVPMFVLPPGALPALEQRGKVQQLDLLAQARPEAEGVVLDVQNRGPQRVRLSQLSFVSVDGQAQLLEPGLLGYVLSGQRMQWTVRLAPGRFAAGGTFKVRLNDDAEAKALPLAAPSR